MGKRRDRRLRTKPKQTSVGAQQQPVVQRSTRKVSFYARYYRILMLIPIVLFVLAVGQISFQYATTGDFLNRGVTLSGGITIVVNEPIEMSVADVRDMIAQQFPAKDIVVREMRERGQSIGLVIESDAQTEEQRDDLLRFVDTIYGTSIDSNKISVESTGAALGEQFFRQILLALILAFVFMGVVVFIIFRTFVPSMAVILATLIDIVVTLAVVNVLEIKLSSAGIAAFLMLVGYSVDTDILLSTRVLKRKEGSLDERILGAVKTGSMMTVTTLVALMTALLVTDSGVITQIMTILIIGLIVDLITTWTLNVGMLRWYVTRGDQ